MNHMPKLHQVFFACCMWPWLGPPLAALQYVVMYFRFSDDVMLVHNRPAEYGVYLK